MVHDASGFTRGVRRSVGGGLATLDGQCGLQTHNNSSVAYVRQALRHCNLSRLLHCGLPLLILGSLRLVRLPYWAGPVSIDTDPTLARNPIALPAPEANPEGKFCGHYICVVWLLSHCSRRYLQYLGHI